MKPLFSQFKKSTKALYIHIECLIDVCNCISFFYKQVWRIALKRDTTNEDEN